MRRNVDPIVEAYLDVLEQAMVDRYLSAHEEQALIEVAMELGLQRDQLAGVHATYLDSLAHAALADGVVTDDEERELVEVALMLGLPRSLVAAALARAGGESGKRSALRLQRGDRIVFTGELSLPRDQWIARIEAVGLAHGAVTKGTKLVVAADPDSQSGKAVKARSYNVPVVTEAAFARLLAEFQS
jgi:DNA polymerase-3 subunit epsilon